MPDEAEARNRWRALGDSIEFTPKDFEVLDLTLSLMPDLRICALALKYARAKGVHYPISSVDDLIKHLEKGQFVAGTHIIDSDTIKTYMPKELFPIEHEGELLSKIYTALGRQRYETTVLSTVQLTTIEKFLAAHH